MTSSIGSRLGTTQTQDLVLLAVVGLGAYVVYEVIKTLKKVGDGANTAYHYAKLAADPMASVLVNIWKNLSPSMLSTMQVPGNVLWPDGSKTPIADLAVKQDSLGNVYVSDGKGLLFQLQPSNSQGDWPATQITDPSQIGTAPARDLPVDFDVTSSEWN